MAFVTPEQAKKMRCCKPEFVNCKADECMGWRWKPKETRWVKEGNVIPDGWIPSTTWDANLSQIEDGKYTEYEKVETEKTGYCGIAGHISMYD